jgi:hypothetical protein
MSGEFSFISLGVLNVPKNVGDIARRIVVSANSDQQLSLRLDRAALVLVELLALVACARSKAIVSLISERIEKISLPDLGAIRGTSALLRLGVRGLDVLWLEAHAYESRGELLETGDAGEELHEEGRLDRAGFREDPVKDFVGEDLHALGVVDGALAVVLDAGEVVRCGGSGE